MFDCGFGWEGRWVGDNDGSVVMFDRGVWWVGEVCIGGDRGG